MFFNNGRMRGRMPSREGKALRDLYKQRGRGGESSPASTKMDAFWATYKLIGEIQERGHRKSKGSFTADMNRAFTAWKKEKGIGYFDSLVFKYRLTRKQVITVTMQNSAIRHSSLYGNGSKGFILIGHVKSIDGIKYQSSSPLEVFALNKIIGHEVLHALPEPR